MDTIRLTRAQRAALNMNLGETVRVSGVPAIVHRAPRCDTNGMNRAGIAVLVTARIAHGETRVRETNMELSTVRRAAGSVTMTWCDGTAVCECPDCEAGFPQQPPPSCPDCHNATRGSLCACGRVAA